MQVTKSSSGSGPRWAADSSIARTSAGPTVPWRMREAILSTHRTPPHRLTTSACPQDVDKWGEAGTHDLPRLHVSAEREAFMSFERLAMDAGQVSQAWGWHLPGAPPSEGSPSLDSHLSIFRSTAQPRSSRRNAPKSFGYRGWRGKVSVIRIPGSGIPTFRPAIARTSTATMIGPSLMSIAPRFCLCVVRRPSELACVMPRHPGSRGGSRRER
jgi:hypothetical protein